MKKIQNLNGIELTITFILYNTVQMSHFFFFALNRVDGVKILFGGCFIFGKLSRLHERNRIFFL